MGISRAAVYRAIHSSPEAMLYGPIEAALELVGGSVGGKIRETRISRR
jgi:hypothetical protein